MFQLFVLSILSILSLCKTKRRQFYVSKVALFYVCSLYSLSLLSTTTSSAISTISAGHTFFTSRTNTKNKSYCMKQKYKFKAIGAIARMKAGRIDTSTVRIASFIPNKQQQQQQQHERKSYSSIAPVTTKSSTCIVPTTTKTKKSCFSLFSNSNKAMTDNNYKYQQQQYNQYTNKNNNNNNNNNIPISPIILDPLIVCGPSGVGKGTIIEHYMKQVQQQQQQQLQNLDTTVQQQNNNNTNNLQLPEFKFAISHTTRLPRPNEINGTHYYFISLNEMERLIFDNDNNDNSDNNNINNNNYFLEYAKVHDNYYGTSYQTLLDAQQNYTPNQYQYQHKTRALLDIDVQGVQRIKEIVQLQQEQLQQLQNQDHYGQQQIIVPKYILQPKYIFISPPSIDILYQRLLSRNTESIDIIQKRINNAQNEILYGTTNTNFDTILINNNLQQCIIDFTNAVQQLYNI